jgi:error-prone DNA polymerase
VGYVELHCHSCFSFREGASTPLELVLQAKKLGYGTLALTDHDNLAGAMTFARSAAAWGVRPISGAEVTLSSGHHLTLLAESQRGYATLSRLLTRANLSNERGQPVIDLEWFDGTADGLIALSGCRQGEVPALLRADDHKAARNAGARLRDLFGRDGFFIELQEHLAFEDRTRNRELVVLADELGVEYVATNNVHYHLPARSRLHDTLVAIRHNRSLEDVRQYLRPNAEFYLKSPQQMAALFQDLPAAITNTERIAERCSFDLNTDLSYRFPDFETPDGSSADDFLAAICRRRAREVYGADPDIEQRINTELALIKEGHRAGFFLRLWELLQIAHERDLPVRGRGSSVGSIVCFLLGLSGIDPMKYDLVVERFLNAARLEEDVPDVDLDFGRDARNQMFASIFEKYGTEHAAQVCNFVEYHNPSAIRDVGKALGLETGDIDKVAKRLRSRFSGSLAEELASLPEFAGRLDSHIWRDFLALVQELRGLPRHLSQHSGGVIISSTRMDEQVPIERPAMEGRFIAQWDKDSVADAGMIKLDLLSYPTLDQLYRGLRYASERHGRLIRHEDIPLDDPEVYKMIQAGDVIGVVQIQSRAQIQVLQRILIKDIHDLVIQVALIRPGPIQGGAVNPYIARCQGLEPVTYDHPSLEPVLSETKGVFIFQEQVLQASMAVAGFTSAQAEQLRRAMSRKRSREAMEALHEEFLAGAARNGVSAEIAATVYEKIMAFAEFGFPKSHAAAMAETACKAAWLKRYYPVEFYTALLNEQPMGFYTPEVICNDARRHGIEILPVDVNHSRDQCTVVDDLTLRLGLSYVKGLGESVLRQLEDELDAGLYESLWDFWRRTHLNREQIENLIQVGAFAFTGLHERELLWQLGMFYQPLGKQQPLQLSLGSLVPLPEMSHKERVLADLLFTGIAARGCSFDLIADQIHEGIATSRIVQDMPEGQTVSVAGLVAVRQAPPTAKDFVFHTLEDAFGLINIITKPGLVPKFRDLIERAPALIIHGHIERQERSVNVIAERFEPLSVSADAERRVHSFG